MANVNFLYRSVKDEAFLTARLLYRVGETDFTFDAKTKLEVTKEYWKRYHNQTRIKDVHISNQQNEVNNKINSIKNHVLQAFNNISDVSYVNKAWLEAQIHNFYNPKESAEFTSELVKYMDVYAKLRKHEITSSTLKKINVIKQLLIRFQDYHKTIILIKDVNLAFKTDFENYCRLCHYAPNTIARATRFVKTICRHAKSNGVETSYQLDSIKSKYIKVEPFYLNEDELEVINKASYSTSLENAKDWLIISCYSGQRISDFMRFTKEQIRYEDGKPLIEFTQVKTNKIMTLPLHKKILEILAKRNGDFPVALSDQKYNEYIKKVCQKAGINEKVKGSKRIKVDGKFRKSDGVYEKWELVSSHVGRRSFATNFYGKIPTSLLIGATGHSTEAMFLNYIGKTDTQKAKQLADYF